MLVPTENIERMQAPIHDMEKTSIIMRLLMDLMRVEGKKFRVILDYDPESGMMHATRKEITVEDERKN